MGVAHAPGASMVGAQPDMHGHSPEYSPVAGTERSRVGKGIAGHAGEAQVGCIAARMHRVDRARARGPSICFRRASTATLHGHRARPPCTAMHARYSRPCTIQPTMHYNACSQSGTPTDNTECICKRDSKNRIRAVLVGEHDYLGSDAQLVAQPVLQPPTARHTGY